MDFWHYLFMQKALIAGGILSFLTGVLSFFIINKDLSFIGVGLSHIAFGGIALGLFFNLNPFFSATIFTLIIAFFIARNSASKQISENTSIGIFFSFSMALGIILIGLKQGYSGDIFSFLFGSILSLNQTDIFVLVVLSFMLLFALFFFAKPLLFLLFDPDYGRIHKMPITFLYYCSILFLALVIVNSIKMVGSILLSGLLILPGATAYIMSRNYKQHLAFSIVFAFVSIIGGLILSFYLNLPPGGSIIVIATIIFFIIKMIYAIARRPYAKTK